jgi:ubiquinone/menaquinone biosynthesis C-methylase UbiE
MLKTLSTWFYRLPHKLQAPFERAWYEGISVMDRKAHMVFMNYGWAGLDTGATLLPLLPDDEPDRYCIQLYHRVAGALDLTGLDVLEVGCGRGGGASFVMRYLKPKTITGLDLAANAVAFCRAHYCAVPGLTFVRGNAETLDFGDGVFDVVVNVESSHCYGAMDRFLAGVHRVLKPSGYLLYADHRDSVNVPMLRRQFLEAGLTIVEEERLNDAILRALALDNARKQMLIRAYVPQVLRCFFNQFAAMEGTQSIYETLRRGDKQYLRFVLRKECGRA